MIIGRELDEIYLITIHSFNYSFMTTLIINPKKLGFFISMMLE
jgi:hypothetical protein